MHNHFASVKHIELLKMCKMHTYLLNVQLTSALSFTSHAFHCFSMGCKHVSMLGLPNLYLLNFIGHAYEEHNGLGMCSLLRAKVHALLIKPLIESMTGIHHLGEQMDLLNCSIET